MEALAAIGLVSNLLQFVELGCKLLEKAKDIHQSSVGSTEEDASHSRIATNLEASFVRLSSSTAKRSLSEQEVAVYATASDCADIARQLSQLLDKIRVKGSPSKIKVFKAAIKSTLKGKEKEGLISRLDHAISALNTQLLLLTRSDLVTHLDTSFKWHSVHGTQLQSINAQINTLREDLIEIPHSVAIIASLRKTLDKSHKSLLAVRQRQILESLQFDLMKTREEGIIDAHETTCEWILDSEGPYATPVQESASQSFRSWLQSDGGIYFIMGKPGAGKSVMMKSVSSHPTTRHLLGSALPDGLETIVVKFFFWNAGSNHQKSFNGLVRSLLHSVLQQAPDLIPTALPDEWAETADFAGHSWTAHHDHKKINDVFEQLLRSDLMFRNRRFAFFIDGLDELEGDHQRAVKQIRSWSTIGGSNLKICVSSREWNVFTSSFSDCESLQLQMLTREDMFRTARDTLASNDDLKRLDVSDSILESFVEALVNKAEGVFLWTSLVLRLLQDGLSDGDELRHLQNKLEVLPTELEDLFKHMLTSIKKGDQAYAFKMIYFVSQISSTFFPPLLLRMLFLDLLYEVDYNINPADVLSSECRGLTRKEVENYLKRKLVMLRKRLIGRCKCLLEIRQAEKDKYTAAYKEVEQESTPFFDETVHLAHRKVKEYIESDAVMSLLKTFTGTLDWRTDSLRTLLEHIRFQIESGHIFIGWPRLQDIRMEMHEVCRIGTNCAIDQYPYWLFNEIELMLQSIYLTETVELSTPPYILQFLEDMFNLLEQANQRLQWLKPPCLNGVFGSHCGTTHSVGMLSYYSGHRGLPTLLCGQSSALVAHVSMPHICGYFGVPEFLEKRFTDTWSDSERIYDPAGLVRCITVIRMDSKTPPASSARLAKTLDVFLSRGLRIDQIPNGCWCDYAFETGYDWTIWQIVLCRRLLGDNQRINTEDLDPILAKLLTKGIDTQFCLEVHLDPHEEHVQGVLPETYPFFNHGKVVGRYLLTSIWTRPVSKVPHSCQHSNDQGRSNPARPDHVPITIFLLPEDSKLAVMAKTRGGRLSFAEIVEYMGIQLEARQIRDIEMPPIPSLVGWKLNPGWEFSVYEDTPDVSSGVLTFRTTYKVAGHPSPEREIDTWIKC